MVGTAIWHSAVCKTRIVTNSYFTVAKLSLDVLMEPILLWHSTSYQTISCELSVAIYLIALKCKNQCA